MPIDYLKEHWWKIGTIIVMLAYGKFEIIEIKSRVDTLETIGSRPVRERIQSLEEMGKFTERRLSDAESEAKRNGIVFADFRSKLDILSVQISTVVEWVKNQQRQQNH